MEKTPSSSHSRQWKPQQA